MVAIHFLSVPAMLFCRRLALRSIHRAFAIFGLALALLLALPSLTAETGAAEKQTTSPSVLDELTLIRSNIELIAQLRRQGVEVDADGALANRLLNDASRLTNGRIHSLDTLQAATGTAPTPQERHQGWFTFVHVLWMTGVFAVVLALTILFRHYLTWLIRRVPVRVWEVVLYLVCTGLVAAGLIMPKGYTLAPVMPGCLGFLGCFYFSKHLHRFVPEGWMAWFFVPVWGGAALLYHNETLGFFTVSAALAGLGFFAGMVPGVVYLGFRDSSVIPRTTTAAGAILAGHVSLHCLGLTPAILEPFRTGMGFLGTFVYLLGLLILSSLHFARRGWPSERRWPRYIAMQTLTIASGVAVMYFGSVYRVESLLGIGGTLFYLFLLEKYYELPWRGVGWAWALLGTGGILYGFALFAQAHPEWFFFMQ